MGLLQGHLAVPLNAALGSALPPMGRVGLVRRAVAGAEAIFHHGTLPESLRHAARDHLLTVLLHTCQPLLTPTGPMPPVTDGCTASHADVIDNGGLTMDADATDCGALQGLVGRIELVIGAAAEERVGGFFSLFQHLCDQLLAVCRTTRGPATARARWMQALRLVALITSRWGPCVLLHGWPSLPSSSTFLVSCLVGACLLDRQSTHLLSHPHPSQRPSQSSPPLPTCISTLSPTSTPTLFSHTCARTHTRAHTPHYTHKNSHTYTHSKRDARCSGGHEMRHVRGAVAQHLLVDDGFHPRDEG